MGGAFSADGTRVMHYHGGLALETHDNKIASSAASRKRHAE